MRNQALTTFFANIRHYAENGFALPSHELAKLTFTLKNHMEKLFHDIKKDFISQSTLDNLIQQRQLLARSDLSQEIIESEIQKNVNRLVPKPFPTLIQNLPILQPSSESSSVGSDPFGLLKRNDISTDSSASNKTDELLDKNISPSHSAYSSENELVYHPTHDSTYEEELIPTPIEDMEISESTNCRLDHKIPPSNPENFTSIVSETGNSPAEQASVNISRKSEKNYSKKHLRKGRPARARKKTGYPILPPKTRNSNRQIKFEAVPLSTMQACDFNEMTPDDESLQIMTQAFERSFESFRLTNPSIEETKDWMDYQINTIFKGCKTMAFEFYESLSRDEMK